MNENMVKIQLDENAIDEVSGGAVVVVPVLIYGAAFVAGLTWGTTIGTARAERNNRRNK
ncbi:MAG: hypothetical protein ACK5M4_15055 [Pseudorhodobacter sp.]